MSCDFDVVIIGGGPAGSAAALTLAKRPDISVAILERETYQRPKVGESLSPGVRSLLEYLGVWDTFEATHPIKMLGNEAAWGSDTLGGMDFILTVHGEGWALDRLAFDTMLARQAQARGAQLETNTRVERCQLAGQHWVIETEKGPITARYIIDAAGRVSPFSIAQGAHRQRHDTLTALAARLSPKGPVAQTAKVEAFELGWFYAAPLPSGEVIVCLFSDAGIVHEERLNAPERWLTHLAATKHIGARLDLSVQPETLEALPAFSSLLTGLNEALPMITAGDAAAARDPLSSSGIPNAMGSGIQAARVAADYLFGEGALRAAYHHALASDHAQYLRTHWKTYQIEKRWLAGDFWRFRSSEIKRRPDTLVVATPDQDTSIFVPATVARWITAQSVTARTQLDIAQDVRARFPDIPDERLLLAIEDMTQPLAG